jgi:hypothetical protein
MSLRQLRARLDRLKARFLEGDEESRARARYDHLHYSRMRKRTSTVNSP